jgi:hypothetical protein
MLKSEAPMTTVFRAFRSFDEASAAINKCLDDLVPEEAAELNEMLQAAVESLARMEGEVRTRFHIKVKSVVPK